ncbi:protoporphyrin ix magnesium chelatase : Cobaltochelatase OS=Chthoniobacter flavus Ellin428 GN=CfE428DRAFT_2831 PE=4 SV=1: CobN-Mg_chel [Gemmata massiliana]|uniref:CobN/magnesium chelatase domain-containing protein n=1 Tax=Gemmata massiliana TaxID=1210884 RepID=A0A6P2D692_9BACT|nr:cobaltochelatase subunit CobN [Gemmata massiliana]VTR96669.1 protoporphyrin ix magnesium chelatase : Cobaltochelatase OS=Chthoniobacter flavus Ellin428 GN=CfE428DRAFT_2831 PE=4 SV=1: CobN-Mg_chel [Gemmata massiliana]
MKMLRAPFVIFCLAAFTVAPAAAGESVLVIGGWDYGETMFDRAATSTGMSAKFVATEDTALVTADQLKAADVIFLLNIKPDGAATLKDRVAEAKKVKPGLIVLSLAQRDTQKSFEQAGLMAKDTEIYKYWKYNGFENTKRLLVYTRVKHLKGPGEILPPVVVPDFGVYHPVASDLFPDVPAYIEWAKKTGHFQLGSPRVALLVQQGFLMTGDTKVYEAVISALEKRGVNVAVLFGNHTAGKQKELLDAWKPELIIDDHHASTAIRQGAEELDVPIVKNAMLLRSTVAEWEASIQGMLPADVGLHFLSQEVHGIIDPVVTGAMKANVGGYKLHDPIPDRVERLAGRVMSWLNLRKKANAEKKIAIVYYNKYLGKSDVGRGSATGAFMDGPESLFRVLKALKEHGYTFTKFPKDTAELLSWMKRDGRNVGAWADGDLAELVRGGKPVLLPTTEYEKWFATLSDANRGIVTKAYGPAPGTQMATPDRKAIVLPRIDLGNVILLPQPARGPENDEKLLHAKDVPPPHQYLACYWWLQHGFRADAVMHFGTHGTELLLPGKANGMSADNFGDICLGNMPNVYPWIIDNIAEAITAKRRAYAVTVDHLTPPLETTGLSPELQNLHADIDKFSALEEGLLKQKYRKTISDAARKAALTRHPDDLSDKDIEQIAFQLHQVELSVAAVKLHTLGVEPEEKHLVPFLTSMLGRQFLDDLGRVLPVPAEIAKEPEHVPIWVRPQLEAMVKSIVTGGLSPEEALKVAGAKIPTGDPTKILETLRRVTEYRKALSQSGREVENVLRALEGKFVSPGPGADPVRNPAAIPTGRNLYALNPEEIPTKQAWEVGVQLVDQLLKERPTLRKVALDLNGHETIRDYGVTEAEALYLMGVRPIWDHNNLAVNVEIIPRDQLKRPRIDVFIALGGSMRDTFTSRVKLLDKAIRLVSELNEPDNFVRAGTEEKAAELVKRGLSPEKVKLYAPARMFGAKPGSHGTRILYLVPKTGAWDDRKEIAEVYKQNMSHVFTGEAWGESVPGLYEDAMKGTELVLRTWTSNMTGPLTNHHVYEYAGGLSLAIETTTGKQPKLLFSDVRGTPKVRNFDEVLATEAHVTMLNPKWLKGMTENGYAGAGMMAEVVRNTSGWEATRKGAVSQDLWNEIHAVYAKDKHGLKLKEWMDQVNPHARQEILATLLEAARKGDWKADEVTRRELAREYARNVAQHGDSAGLATGGNQKLQTEVSALLTAQGDPELATLNGAYKTAIAKSAQPPAGSSATASPAPAETPTAVTGNEMTETTSAPSAGEAGRAWVGIGVGATVVLLVVAGAVRRRRAV